MKNYFCLIFLFLLMITGLYAVQSLDGRLIEEGDKFGFTVEPSFGYLTGQAREIVYLNDESDVYLSELIWDLDDILYVGASSSLNYKNRLFINAGLWMGVNDGTGYMNDFDWYNLTGTSYPEYDDYGRTGWTHWSLSSVEIVDSLIFDINLSYDFVSGRKFKFAAVAGFKYIYWDWTDSVLDSLYPSGPDVIETGINAIDYSLALNIPYLGIGASVEVNPLFFVDGRLSYSPAVIGRDHDHHKLRVDYGAGGIHFYDEIFFGQFVSLALKSGINVTDFFRISMMVSGDYLFERRGNTYVYDDDGDYKGRINGGAGIQYQSLSFSLNGAFSF